MSSSSDAGSDTDTDSGSDDDRAPPAERRRRPLERTKPALEATQRATSDRLEPEPEVVPWSTAAAGPDPGGAPRSWNGGRRAGISAGGGSSEGGDPIGEESRAKVKQAASPQAPPFCLRFLGLFLRYCV